MSALYRQISNRILDQIERGEIKVGVRLPPEADYAAEIGVSRSTLRLAFSELESVGVLERKKRAGTQIISDQPKLRFSMATTGINDLLSLGRDTEFEISGTKTVKTEDVPQLIGFESETGHWLEVTGTRTMSGEPTPFSVNRVYVPARYAGIEPLLKIKQTSVFQAIEEAFDISINRVNQAVTAITCPEMDAEIMGLPPKSPAIQINAQLYSQSDILMEISVASFDPNRFQVRTDVKIG